jgi:hypothetical protein
MTTIQVESRVKAALFTVAADLQRRLGRKVSLNEAIDELIRSFRGKNRDREVILSLFGSIRHDKKTKQVLRELRENEERRLDTIARKYGA